MGATRQQIRRYVGRLLGNQPLICRATSPSASTQFTDTLNVKYRNSHLRGVEALVAVSAAPANVGQSRLIFDNDLDTRTVTFSPAFPAAFTEGDEIELWMGRTMGPSAREVHDSINDLISTNGRTALTLSLGDDLEYVSGSLIPSPESLLNGIISRIDYYGDDGQWEMIPPADWETDESTHTIRITSPTIRGYADGRNIRVRGYVTAQPLLAEDDETTVDLEWLAHAVAGQCLMGASARATDPGSMQSRALLFDAKAEKVKGRLVKRTRGQARPI